MDNFTTLKNTVLPETPIEPIPPTDGYIIQPVIDLSPDTTNNETAKETPPYVEEKTLVTVETILDVTKHPNADKLWLVHVQGYVVIINLEMMFPTVDGIPADPKSLIGKNIVYFQIDSIIPVIFQHEGFWQYLQTTYMGKKLISAKIRGTISQGLICTFESLARLFPEIAFEILPVGHNLTNALGVIKHYSKYDADGPMYGGAYDKSLYKSRILPASMKPFPHFLVKTDQERLQNNIGLIRKLGPERLFTVQVKFDGQSVQWFCNGENSGVCSRNYQVLLEYDLPVESRDASNDKFRTINEKYTLLDNLATYCAKHGRSLSIQTEMYGMSINGNRHERNDIDIAVFDVYDITAHKYLSFTEVEQIADALGLPKVTVVFRDKPFTSHEVSSWIELANAQRYVKHDGKKLLAEGIVAKSSDSLEPYVSFKVISPEYLVRHGL